MNYRRYIFISKVLLLLVFGHTVCLAYYLFRIEEFSSKYEEKIASVNVFLKCHETELDIMFGDDRQLALAIIIPEFYRVGTSGSSHLFFLNRHFNADFSVGPFQMKPSFIRRMASEYKVSYIDTSFNRQCYWLKNFIAMVRKLHGNYIERLGSVEKVAFFANCYNLGLHYTKEFLRFNRAKNFPYTYLLKYFNQYSYAEISIAYYLSKR